ncbi:hypothetical protein WA158_005918 [Blastocystis sp. Blastoise]
MKYLSNLHIPRRNPCRRSVGYNKEVSRISPVTKEIFLESMTVKDIINMYKTIQFYFTDKHPDFEGKVFSYLVSQFYMVLKQTDCEIERTSFDGICILYMHDQFSEDIPYEYIYPSNLHELFPKLQIYNISFDYYPELECFRVPYSDLHYKRLYSIYKQNYYNMSSLLLYNTYLKRLTEEKLLELVKKQLVIYTKIDFWKQLKNKIKNVDEHLVRGTLPDEYNNDEYKDYRPPLYVECYSDYSREYNKQNEKQLNDKQSCSILFYFQNKNEFPDELIGLLTFSENYYVDKIASYIYNMPQCKQLNTIKCIGANKEEAENKCISLSLSIPALLSALNNGIFDNLEKMNISTYNMEDSTQYIFYKSLFLSFSREHFPQLHILNISSYYTNRFSESLVASMKDIYTLFDSSLFELIDTIIIDYHFCYYIIKYGKEIVDVLINAYKRHQFTLKLPVLNLKEYSIYWQQLLKSNILLCENLFLSSVSICDFGSKEILPDLSKNYFKEIIFSIRDSLSQNCDQQLINTVNTINCQKLEEIRIDISSTKSYSYLYDDNQSSSNADIISFQKCLTLFSSNIKYLKINYGCLCDMIYVLQNIMEFPLWINVEELSICFYNNRLKDILDQFIRYFNNHKLLKLKDLSIGIISLVDSIQPILSFIENIQNNPSLSFPKLDSFYIEYLSDPDNSIVKHVDYNILKSFPSLSFYLHIPITEIYMHSQLGKLRKTSFEYCQYIYNQLQMEYTKTVSKLHIIMQNNNYSDEIIKLIVTGKFPFLKELQLLSCEENKIDEIEQLINNYMKTSNHWFIFFIKKAF